MFFIFRLLYFIIFFLNGLVILNNDRFLKRVGFSLDGKDREHLTVNKQKITDILRLVRTVGRIPILTVNILCIIYELLLG
ncbi:hypothetical protein SLOPH_2735 [Spraguea lophii 42_110]|uniref:Yos1-like protein n=1 Tax=Spraguea lophii (strain 42_110) TaxID=1358809 RepID=S7XTN6_SPRLO|nr:hypothetical protein SLOPH_2735 [Spraguea lophii 42_110]